MTTVSRFMRSASLILLCALLGWQISGCESTPKPGSGTKPAAKAKEAKAKPSAPVANATPAPARVAPTPDSARTAPANAPAPAAASTPASAIPADIQALNEGIALYNDGDYNAAIAKLGNAPAIWSAPKKSTQLTALKYLAFSYCVSSRPVQCRQQFERALKLDPGFGLLPSEIGHPIWGPVFLQAKKAK